MQTDRKNKYGLLGKDIAYSFSENYFAEKFKQLNLEGYTYDNFDLQDLSSFKEILSGTKNLNGMNVTIPYKESVIPFLTKLDPTAAAIGAVNTIKFTEEGTIGYNTDVIGFKNAIEPLIMPHHKKSTHPWYWWCLKGCSPCFQRLRNSFSLCVQTVKRRSN